MNPTEQDIYFELLRAALWEHEAESSVFVGQWSWKSLLLALGKNDQLGVVAHVIMQLPDALRPSEMECGQILNYISNSLKAHQNLNQKLSVIFSKLEAAQCRPLLLKGQGLSVLYPSSCLRACGDLDIYVGDSSFDRAKRVINAMATPEDLASADDDDASHHYQITLDGIIYEIHRIAGIAGNLNCSAAFEQLSREYLESDNQDKVTLSVGVDQHIQIAVPPIAFNVWYVFNHLMEHFCYVGTGIRQFCDWLMVVREFNRHAGSQELSVLKCQLQQVGLLRAWQILGGILVYQLGLPAEQFPLYDARLAAKSQGFVVNELVGGNSFRFQSIDALMKQPRNGWNRLFYNLRFYYYTSRQHMVFSPVAPYMNFAAYLLRGCRNAIASLYSSNSE